MENLPKPQFPKAEELPENMRPWGRRLLQALTIFTDELAKRHKRILAENADSQVGIGTISPSGYADLTLENGVLCIKETTEPRRRH